MLAWFILVLGALASLGQSCEEDVMIRHIGRRFVRTSPIPVNVTFYRCKINTEQDVESIQKFFKELPEKSQKRIDLVFKSAIPIPADFMGGVGTEELNLIGGSPSDSELVPLPPIHPNAFQGSKDLLTLVKLDNLNLVGSDLSFFDNFKIYSLFVDRSSLNNFTSAAQLPDLRFINIERSRVLDNWPFKESLTPSLNYVNLETVDSLQQQVFDSIPSTITSLKCNSCRVSNAPKLGRLKQLGSVDLSESGIKVLTADMFPVMNDPSHIRLQKMGIERIEPGTFKGTFKSTAMWLFDNKLTRFESSVFKDVLKSMVGSYGSVDIEKNKIECDCHLAWLVRDNPNLIPYTSGGVCTNGKKFEELSPKEFSECT